MVYENRRNDWKISPSVWIYGLASLFNGEASDNEINRGLVGRRKWLWFGHWLGEERPSIVRKLLPIFKITSCDCSTIASTDAPVSSDQLSTQMRVPLRYIFYSKNPELVLWIAKWSLKHQNACSVLDRRWLSNLGEACRMQRMEKKPCWVNDKP